MNINGRMKVKTLKSQFKDEFGLTLRVYDGRSFADDDSTLAAIRKGDAKGGEFSPRKNTKVGNFENKIQEIFGIKVQIAGSDDSYLCDNDLTLHGAFGEDAKKLKRKQKKQDIEDDNGDEPDDDFESDEAEAIDDDEFEDMPSDLIDQAQELIEEGDSGQAHDLLDQAVADAFDPMDMVYAASVIAEGLGDDYKSWAKDIYQDAYNESDEFDVLKEIAVQVQSDSNISDKEWSKSIFQELEKDSDLPNNFIDLAESVFDCFGDVEWTKNLLVKAKKYVDKDSDEYEWLSERITDVEIRISE